MNGKTNKQGQTLRELLTQLKLEWLALIEDIKKGIRIVLGKEEKDQVKEPVIDLGEIKELGKDFNLEIKAAPVVDFKLPNNEIIRTNKEMAEEYQKLGKVITESQAITLEEGVEFATMLISRIPEDIFTASYKIQMLIAAGVDPKELLEKPEKLNDLYNNLLVKEQIMPVQYEVTISYTNEQYKRNSISMVRLKAAQYIDILEEHGEPTPEEEKAAYLYLFGNYPTRYKKMIDKAIRLENKKRIKESIREFRAADLSPGRINKEKAAIKVNGKEVNLVYHKETLSLADELIKAAAATGVTAEELKGLLRTYKAILENRPESVGLIDPGLLREAQKKNRAARKEKKKVNKHIGIYRRTKKGRIRKKKSRQVLEIIDNSQLYGKYYSLDYALLDDMRSYL